MSETTSSRVVVFGASGFIGREVVQRLANDGYQVVAVGRSPARLAPLPAEPVIFDLDDKNIQSSPVRSGDIVIQISYLYHTEQVVKLCPPDIEKLVVVGSTRYLSQLPDPVADGVRGAIDYLKTVELPWVVVHPTLIYGGEADNDLSGIGSMNGMQRIKRLIMRLPIIPLPNFGAALIQPIHIDDVYRSILKAMADPTLLKTNINLAGPKAMTLKHFIKMVAKSMHLRRLIVPVPMSLLLFINNVGRWIPGFPRLGELEIRSLAVNRDVDISGMTNLLQVIPRDFEATQK